MVFKKSLLVAILVCAASVSSSLDAATTTTTFNVLITITKACTVTAGPNLNFGSVTSATTNTTANTTFSVLCSLTTPYYVGLSPSTANGGGTTGNGFMISSTAPATNLSKVPYQLNSTAGTGGTPWGNTATSTTVGNGVAGLGTGLAQTLTVYGVVANADFTPDSYTDTVTITVNY